MALAEVGDGAAVRAVQAGHCHDIDPLLAGPGELTRRVQAAAVAVEKQGYHHAGMVGRVSTLLRVGIENDREVERLSHRIPNEVRHVPGWHQLVQRGRQQPTLIDVPGAKHLGHEPSESPPSLAVEKVTRTGS